MSGFLDEMARSSAQRVRQAVMQESLAALERRAREAPHSAALRLSERGFDVIAELKLRSPAAGVLGAPSEDWLQRVAAYAHGGAAAVSVLTEPSRFDGSLQHLHDASRVLKPLGIPAMRKDFLLDPYQVLEARAAGAGGVLLILRMLSKGQISELLDAAAAMFRRLNSYSDAAAADAIDKGQTPTFRSAFRRLFSRGWKSYVARRGYREGAYGIALALFSALYPMLTYLKVVTRSDAAEREKGTP